MRQTKYIVKMTSDAVGYYVVEMIAGMEMYIKGTSYNKKEMLALAEKLNEDAWLLKVEEKYQEMK